MSGPNVRNSAMRGDEIAVPGTWVDIIMQIGTHVLKNIKSGEQEDVKSKQIRRLEKSFTYAMVIILILVVINAALIHQLYFRSL